MEGIPPADLAAWKKRQVEESGQPYLEPRPKKAKYSKAVLTTAEVQQQLAAHKALMSGQPLPGTVPNMPGGGYGIPPPGFGVPPPGFGVPPPGFGIPPPPGFAGFPGPPPPMGFVPPPFSGPPGMPPPPFGFPPPGQFGGFPPG